MSGFNQVFIGGYPTGGLVTDRKPFLLENEAFTVLFNAYAWRGRVKKRDGIKLVGRLEILINAESLPVVSTSPTYSVNLLTTIHATIPTAELAPGSVSLTFDTAGNATTFTDNGQGGFTRTSGTAYQINTAITASHVNYVTGAILLTFTIAPANGVVVSASFGYYPTLPSMGISTQFINTEGINNTVYFDEVNAYQFVTGTFQQFGTATWTGNQTDFFWTTNYQGADASFKLFFATNDNIDIPTAIYDPIRYYDTSWHDFQPLLTATTTLWQALIIVPYYGRLLALNTWEGLTASTFTGASNFFARVRFSALGSPIATNAWRSDMFGQGGFLDAPTGESIVSAGFFRNTLIVFFEYSTWQLRYVGEYGLPFIWERVSADFGSTSTFSSIIFDKGIMAISNRGIISASAGGLQRIDEQIPETVFSMQISSSLSAVNNQAFVHGIRDFEKEVVYWNYVDSSQVPFIPLDDNSNPVFPNTVLLYNYKNNSWAQFRDNVTCFGTAQFSTGVTWDSFSIIWDSSVSWDSQDSQIDTNYIVSGNQQGFIHIYEYGGDDVDLNPPYPSILEYDPSLSVTAVDLTVSPNQITVNNNNLSDGEVIYLSNLAWEGPNPGLSNKIYSVTKLNVGGVVSDDILQIMIWDAAAGIYVNTPIVVGPPIYLGAGVLALLPVVNIITKDFNPYQATGKQFKLSYVDFLFDSSRENGITGFNIQLFINTYMNQQGNVVVSNQDLLNSSPSGIITGAATGAIPEANPCVITSPKYSLPTGTEIYISNILGTTQLNAAIYTITVIDDDHFSLDGINATGFSAYISGGTWNQINNPLIPSGSSYSDYRWYRFYSTQFGQYIRLGITYDNILMNQICTHQTGFELNGMNFWFREGGRLIGY